MTTNTEIKQGARVKVTIGYVTRGEPLSLPDGDYVLTPASQQGAGEFPQDERATDREKFFAHLKAASKAVESWPDWKKNIWPDCVNAAVAAGLMEPPAQRAASVPAEAVQLVGEVVLFGGELKEVSWTKGRMPAVGAKLYAGPVPAASVQAETITLTGHQLRIAADFINPDGLDDPDQLDDDLTFGVRQHQDDDGKISTGMCCWNDDTDGVLPLDGEYEAATVPQDIGRDAALVQALKDIVNPIEAMRREVPEGYKFEGGMASHMAGNPTWYQQRAQKALDALSATPPTNVAQAAPEVASVPDAGLTGRVAELELLLQKAAQGLRFRSQYTNGDPALEELWKYMTKHYPQHEGRMSGWASMRKDWETTSGAHCFGCQCKACLAAAPQTTEKP